MASTVTELMRRRVMGVSEDIIYHVSDVTLFHVETLDTGIPIANGMAFEMVVNFTTDGIANNSVLWSVRLNAGGVSGFDFRFFSNKYEMVYNADQYFQHSSLTPSKTETLIIRHEKDDNYVTCTLGEDTIQVALVTNNKTLVLGGYIGQDNSVYFNDVTIKAL